MIRKQVQKDGSVKVTFALAEASGPISVITDLDEWARDAHPLRRRSNGHLSVAITVPAGRLVRFRYATADGDYFDDPDADAFEPNGFGQTHAVVAC